MIDVCQTIRSVLIAKGFSPVYLKRLDNLTGREGIVVRPVFPQVSRRYIDTSRTIEYIVAVMCRYHSEQTAMETCSDIADLLDGYPLPSSNASYEWTETQVYTGPQELSLDEAGMYVWAVQLSVFIERKER